MARNVPPTINTPSDGPVQPPPPAASAPVQEQATNPHAASSALPLVTAGKAPQMGGMPGLPMTGVETRITYGNGNVVGSAVTGHNANVNVPFKRYRVLNGGWLMDNGVRTALRAGKIVDERNYNIQRLYGQGFKLEEVKDDEFSTTEQASIDPPLPPLMGAPR